jgi:TetR/AcrR family tetracycline transcriptional repressor
MARRGPGERAGLSRAAVVDAARNLLERGGVVAISMRAVARSLGVSPNALYSHVADKDALVDLLLDDLLAAVPRPVDVVDPMAALVDLLAATFDALAKAPDLVAVALSRQGSRGDAAVELGELMDALLARGGVDGDVAGARRVLIVHVIGFAAFAVPPGGAGVGTPLDTSEVRALFLSSTKWLLTGILTG